MKKPTLGWAALVAATIVAFYALDVFLQHVETAELQNQALGLYKAGEALLAAGRPIEGAISLQRAYTLQRKNRTYQLSYAEVLIATGSLEEAGEILNEAIGQRPNDGRANLLLARLERARNSWDEEAAYYHRAIYGVWHENRPVHVNEARLEWVRELAKRGDRKTLLGELLPLEAATKDPRVLMQIAQYYLEAGTPGRSANLYRSLLASHVDDAVLEKGLGEAETAAGNYTAAQRAFLRAFRANPADQSIRHQMELSSALSAIDPTPRRLSSREKYERSLRILILVHDFLIICGSQSVAVDKNSALKNPNFSNEAAEQLLHQAELLWQQRPHGCAQPEILTPLMTKLTQP